MANDSEDTVCVHVSMKRYERDLIDHRARVTGMSRSAFMVDRSAYGEIKYILPLDDGTVKKPYQEQIHSSKTAVLEAYTEVDSKKPRKAADNELRARDLHIQLSPYEQETIRAAAKRNGVSITEYILLNTVYRPLSNHPLLQREELTNNYRELRAQGRNLNQIAAAVNRIASVVWRDDVDGSLINQLCETLLEDNERTRTDINDAIKATLDLLAKTGTYRKQRIRKKVNNEDND